VTVISGPGIPRA